MTGQLTIAIDYDDTFTADRDCWREVITVLQKYGHRVVCATSRFNNDENRELVKNDIPVPVYFCDHNYKREMLEKAGCKPDIWIDDTPESIGERMKSPGAKIA